MSAVDNKDRFFLSAIILAILIFFYFRLPRGVDVTDEAYYLTHSIELLRNSFTGSFNLNIQQLSELFVYPLFSAYVTITGNVDGVFLFMRVIYLLIAILACVPLYICVARLRSPSTAAITFAFGVMFIPFGLPAPSYNTLGMYGVVSGLALYGLALLKVDRLATTRLQQLRPAVWALAGSAGIWVATIVAYPTLAVGPPVLAVLSLIILRGSALRFLVIAFLLLCAIAAALGLLLLCGLFGIDRLYRMIEFTNNSAELGSRLSTKILTSIAALGKEPLAASSLVLVVVAAIIALPFARRHEDAALNVLCAVFVAAATLMLMAPPVAFIKPHDIIVLCCVFSVCAVSTMRPTRPETPLFRLIIYTSFIAGLVTAGTATNGIFNFFVGGMMAACLGLAFVARVPQGGTTMTKAIRLAPLVISLLAVSFGSWKHVYGEYGTQFPDNPRRVESGPFKGLWTAQATEAYVTDVADILRRFGSSSQTMTVFGPNAAIYLMSEMRPLALSTYMISGAMGERAQAIMGDFLSAQQPDFVARNITPWTPPAARLETDLLKQYELVSRTTIGHNTFELYRRTTGTPPAS